MRRDRKPLPASGDMGALLSQRRFALHATTAEVASADGTWSQLDVIDLERRYTIDVELITRYSNALAKIRAERPSHGA